MATRSPISVLQEFMAQQKKALPTYLEVPSDLPHYEFKCVVIFNSKNATGYAHTKKEAKHNAAEEALVKLGVGLSNAFKTNNKDTTSNLINNVGILNEHASGRKLPYPVYYDQIQQNGQFVVECRYLKSTTQGVGASKKIAKQIAAQKMLQEMKTEDVVYTPALPQIKMPSHNTENSDLIEKIIEQCEKISPNVEPVMVPNPSGIKFPIFEDVNNAKNIDEVITKLKLSGYEPNVEVFKEDPYIITLKVNKNIVVMGHGKTKEEAMADLVSNSNIIFNDDSKS